MFLVLPRYPPRRLGADIWDEPHSRFEGRPPRDHPFPDDGPSHRPRWDFDEGGRDGPFPPRDDPYYRDYYDRYGREPYGDRYDRDPYDDRYPDRYRDSLRPRDRSPYPPKHPDDPYGGHPRDRWDPYGRDPRDEEREPLPGPHSSRGDQPAVVDYGHGTGLRGERRKLYCAMHCSVHSGFFISFKLE